MSDNEGDAGPWAETVEVPPGIQLLGPDFNADVQMLICLGAVVRASSSLEFGLRELFCALEASKYATVTAAGQSADWLLRMGEALVKRRMDVSDEHRARLIALLNEARGAIQERNRYVHDVWTGAASGARQLMRSQRKSHNLTFKPVTLEGLIQTSQTLIKCRFELDNWIFEALGDDSLSTEAQLRWEDYVQSLSPRELEAMVERRSAAKNFPERET